MVVAESFLRGSRRLRLQAATQQALGARGLLEHRRRRQRTVLASQVAAAPERAQPTQAGAAAKPPHAGHAGGRARIGASLASGERQLEVLLTLGGLRGLLERA